MPDTTPTTLTHLFATSRLLTSACGLDMLDQKAAGGGGTIYPGQVTCFACRNSRPFHLAQQDHGKLLQRRAPEPLTPPVKLSGVMAQHPVMADLYAESIERGEDTPRFLHDCSDCEYLGYAMHHGKRHELYWCHAPEEGNVLSRYGNNGPDYYSGLSAAWNDPTLALAVVRAIHKGLLPARSLGLL